MKLFTAKLILSLFFTLIFLTALCVFLAVIAAAIVMIPLLLLAALPLCFLSALGEDLFTWAINEVYNNEDERSDKITPGS